MNRLLRLLPVGAVLTGLIATTGCMDHTFTDPCWPDRYSHQARSLVVANYEPQIANGHTLDQTIWNDHFERGTDKLNLSGQDKVDQLVRRRPHPDAKVYLATARDITYDPAKPEEYVKARADLDSKREKALRDYWNAQTAGRPIPIEIVVHDPSHPDIRGAAPRVILPRPMTRIGAATGGFGGGVGGTPIQGGTASPNTGTMSGGNTPPPPPPPTTNP
jgi:hypothetical protein